MAAQIEQQERITSRELLDIIGITPADNHEGYHTAIPWKSKLAGDQLKLLIHYDQILNTLGSTPWLFGPFSFAAHWQKAYLDTFIVDPVVQEARQAIAKGKNPDIYADTNSFIYDRYGKLLYELCGHVMTDGIFDRKKAEKLSTQAKGQELLKKYTEQFSTLENLYNSRGLTRLKAMKDLLKCLLMAITETSIEEELPFMKKNPDGTDALPLPAYLQENRARFESLYRANAFDIMEYSERQTGGKIGYSKYTVVEGSALHGMTLRHYPLPDGLAPNNKVLYVATPLINRPEIFDLDAGKSVIEGMLKDGFHVYMVDPGDADPDASELGLDFYGKTVPDAYLDIIKKRHPGLDIYVMAYCMGGSIILPYIARRAQERLARGEEMDVKKIALMAVPVKFDDRESGHGPMREVIRQQYDPAVMDQLFGGINIPPQVIQFGMNEIQPGVQYTVSLGFYARANYPHALEDSAPFIYWLTHGTKFPAKAHRQWLDKFFMGNQLVEGTYTLPSSVPALDGKPVNMNALREAGVRIFCYRGTRDPIAPPGSCVAAELWGQTDGGNISIARGGLNRTIEKNVGHIFVVSKQLLGEYLEIVSDFFRN
ncbi:MAG: hypothetical protein NT072_02385 [Deltaproteobacteria bacterium]|nr:hypothetical protein [Deltaproteobacteria bacterium]